jgi:Circularly permutated YpsA SLOG family
VEGSDGTLWLGRTDTPSSATTLRACLRMGRPFLAIPIEDLPLYTLQVVQWLTDDGIRILHVAGNPEATEPGVGFLVELFLRRVFVMTQQAGDASES